MAPQGLPVQLTSFVGRERETAQLRRLLAEARLVTVTGPGGGGKTRIAIEAARDWGGDAARFVELAPLLDPALIPSAIAAVLGIAEVAGEPLLDTIVRALQSLRALLILDNCEHLIVGCALIVERLLQACPLLTVLATSREPLNLGGETLQRLLPLEPSAAAALFIERATAAEPRFAVKPREPALVESLCRQLDGLPLAIELAAPYVRLLSLQELAAQLDQRLELLQARWPTAAARHQTLRALVDWSYELLTADERRLCRRLSVFAGGGTLESIAGICWEAGREANPPAALLPLLRSLVEKSLVLADEAEGETRYSMLETLRQYARERLREAGEERDVRRRHLKWFLDLAEQEGRRRGDGQDGRHRRIEQDVENIRVALVWSRIEPQQQESGLRLAAALQQFWRLSGRAGEGLEWLTTSLEGAPPNTARAKALEAAGWLILRRGDPEAAQPFLDEALPLARSLDEPSLVVDSLIDLAFLRLQRGDAASAQALAEEGLTIVREQDTGRSPLELLRYLGLASAMLGRTEEGVSYLREAVRLARERQVLVVANLALGNLGMLLVELGDLPAGRECLEESIAPHMRGALQETTRNLAQFVGLAIAEGDMARAVRLAGAVSGLRASRPDRLPPVPWEHLEQYLEIASQALDPAVRQATWAKGVAMSLDEAIDEALRRGSADRDAGDRPGGLTPRELEVARLLAGGLTNRRIAETLVISERTADRHVENILGKLGLSSRAEVAVWAVERGLVASRDR